MERRDTSTCDFEVASEVLVRVAVPTRPILNVSVYIFDHAGRVIDELTTKLAPAGTFAQVVDEMALLGEKGRLDVGDIWM